MGQLAHFWATGQPNTFLAWPQPQRPRPFTVMAINSGRQPGSLSVSAELSCGVETTQPRHYDTAMVCAHGPLNLMCLLKDHSSFKGMPCTSSGLDGAPLLRPWPYALHLSPGCSPHLRLRRASLCQCAMIIYCRTVHTDLRGLPTSYTFRV